MRTLRFPITLSGGLLFSSVLCLGARDPLGQTFVVLGVGLVGLVAWWSQSPGSSTRSTRGVVLAMAPLPLLCAAQIAANLWFGWSAAALIDQAQFTTLMVAYLVFLASLLRAAPHRSDTTPLVVALVALGMAEASYGVLNLLTGNEYLLVYRRWSDATAATGTLVSKNHFAYLLELTIPLAVAMFVSMWGRARPKTSSGADEQARAALFGGGVAMMLLGLLLSRSRMGLTSLAAATAVIALVEFLLRPAGRHAASRESGRTPLVLVAAVTSLLLAGIGIDAAFERFTRVASDLEGGRLPIWHETWAMFQAGPLFGHGFGSYTSLIDGYRQSPTGLAFAHAHSDYLEVAAEGGLAGLSVVAAWLFFFGRRACRAFASVADPEKRRLTMATAVAILSVALHSTVDFGLRIPGVVLVLLFVVTIFVRASEPVSSGGTAAAPL